MGGISSAVPEDLETYAQGAGELNQALRQEAASLGEALAAFRASDSEYAPAVPALEDDVARLAVEGQVMAAQVGAVGRAFAEAGGSGSLVTAMPSGFVGLVLGGAGFGLGLAPGTGTAGAGAGAPGGLFDRFYAWLSRANGVWRPLELADKIIQRGRERSVAWVQRSWARLRAWAVRFAGPVQASGARAATWVGRSTRTAGRGLRGLGFAAPAMQQYRRDTERADVSPTEAVLRAGIAGGVRGTAGWAMNIAVANASLALGAAAAPAGGVGGVAVGGAVFVAGLYAMGRIDQDVLDPGLQRLLDSPQGRAVTSTVAESIDAAGRRVAVQAEPAVAAAGEAAAGGRASWATIQTGLDEVATTLEAARGELAGQASATAATAGAHTVAGAVDVADRLDQGRDDAAGQLAAGGGKLAGEVATTADALDDAAGFRETVATLTAGAAEMAGTATQTAGDVAATTGRTMAGVNADTAATAERVATSLRQGTAGLADTATRTGAAVADTTEQTTTEVAETLDETLTRIREALER